MIKTKPQTLIVDNKYCPGCGHGVINRLVAEVVARHLDGGADHGAA